MRLVTSRAAVFGRATSGLAAVEFAIILPFLILLMVGGFEVSRYLHLHFRVTQTAGNVGLMLSQYDRVLQPVDIETVRNSAPLVLPEARMNRSVEYTSWSDRMAIDIASVEIRAVGNRKFEAKPVWTTAGSRRSCQILQPLNSAKDNYDPARLPKALLNGAGSVIVVDVIYKFEPIITSSRFKIKMMNIERSVYIEPRLVNIIRYDDSDKSVASNCP